MPPAQHHSYTHKTLMERGREGEEGGKDVPSRHVGRERGKRGEEGGKDVPSRHVGREGERERRGEKM